MARPLGALLGEGLRWAGAFARGRAPRSPHSLARRAGVLLEAMRPHYFVFPAGAVLAGAASAGAARSAAGVWLMAAAAGVGWGVGQLLNDLHDREADALVEPGRAAPRGDLPEGPTVAIAAALGIAVAAVAVSVHPRAWCAAVVAAALLIGYDLAKRVPLLGNAVHGALVASAAALGALAAQPALGLGEVLHRARPTLLVAGGLAALYLQANYEKDRASDAAVGARTLAHLAGVRGSAAVRALALAGLLLAARGDPWLRTPAALVVAAAGASLVVASIVGSLLRERAAIGAYRAAVHGHALLMLAGAADLLGAPGLAATALASAAAIERAFRRGGA
ncbi:MAG: UbiA family prenyltransferase [Polyangiaceae bacterium]|nr:UbiA family prenyltransferase [Polyangiaceae bacterium]